MRFHSSHSTDLPKPVHTTSDVSPHRHQSCMTSDERNLTPAARTRADTAMLRRTCRGWKNLQPPACSQPATQRCTHATYAINAPIPVSTNSSASLYVLVNVLVGGHLGYCSRQRKLDPGLEPVSDLTAESDGWRIFSQQTVRRRFVICSDL